MYNNYYDCENKCEFEFGKSKKCMECEYYESYLVEKEIDEFERKQDEALESYLSRLENGEHMGI